MLAGKNTLSDGSTFTLIPGVSDIDRGRVAEIRHHNHSGLVKEAEEICPCRFLDLFGDNEYQIKADNEADE